MHEAFESKKVLSINKTSLGLECKSCPGFIYIWAAMAPDSFLLKNFLAPPTVVGPLVLLDRDKRKHMYIPVSSLLIAD